MSFVQYETNQQKIENEYNKDKKQKQSEETTKIPFHYLKKGKTILRVLPPYNADGVWFKEYYEHRLTVGGKSVSFTCLRQFSQACALCDKGEAMSEAGDALYKDYQPRKAYLFNVVVLSDPTGVTAKDGVKVLKAGVTIKKKLVDLDRAYAEGYGNITGIADGFNLAVEREGETMKDTRYDIKPFRERTNLEEVLKVQGINTANFTQHNLDEAIPAPRPTEEMLAAIEGKKAVFGFPVVVQNADTRVTKPEATSVSPAVQVVPVPEIPEPPSA